MVACEHTAPTAVDIFFRACAQDLRVLRYVHAERHIWEQRLFDYIVNRCPCSNESYLLKTQWATTICTVVHPHLTFEDIVDIMIYSVMCMDYDCVTIDEKARDAFIINSLHQYDNVTRKSKKRAREE